MPSRKTTCIQAVTISHAHSVAVGNKSIVLIFKVPFGPGMKLEVEMCHINSEKIKMFKTWFSGVLGCRGVSKLSNLSFVSLRRVSTLESGWGRS